MTTSTELLTRIRALEERLSLSENVSNDQILVRRDVRRLEAKVSSLTWTVEDLSQRALAQNHARVPWWKSLMWV